MENVLLQYGAIGIIAIVSMLMVRVLFQQVQKDKERETARADRNEQALLEQNRVTMEQVIPAILNMVNMTKELTDLIALERERRRSQ